MELQKIDRSYSYREKAYQELKKGIIGLLFKPGQPLYERELSERLGVSRTPVREALQLLEREGWVRTVPWKGVYVSEISAQDMEEVLQLRCANEALVVELVTSRITDEQVQELEAIFKEQRSRLLSENNQAFIDSDRDFHMRLAEMSGNRRLTQLLLTLSDQMRRLGVQAVTIPGRVNGTMEEHRKILDALRERDTQKAREAMVFHIENTRTAVISALQSESGAGGGNK